MVKAKQSAKKKKESKEKPDVYRSGGKYLCGGCDSEVDFGKDCPVCKKSIIWDKIIGQLRYL